MSLIKVYSCYSSGEGFYQILNNNKFFVFLNVVYPCSIKDLYKGFSLKKDYTLKVLSVRSFIKLAAIRDNNFLLSFLYPRGFISCIALGQITGASKFFKFAEGLQDIGEMVAVKVGPNIIVTVDFWKNSLNYGQYFDYLIVIKLLIKVLYIFFNFNHNIFNFVKLFSRLNG